MKEMSDSIISVTGKGFDVLWDKYIRQNPPFGAEVFVALGISTVFRVYQARLVTARKRTKSFLLCNARCVIFQFCLGDKLFIA